MLALLSTVFMWWGLKIEDLLPGRHAVSVILHFHKNITVSMDYLDQLVKVNGYMIATGSFIVAKHADKSEWRFVIISRGKSTSLVNFSHALSADERIETFHLSHARN